MKKLICLLLFVVLSFLGVEEIRGVVPLTREQSLAWAYNPAISIFNDALQPYGEWVLTRDYGSVWKPHRVSRNWRPYTQGRWIFTDYGWTWFSYEPWGWACFHYGRWYFDSFYGWVWYPDTVWAPAWVFWCTYGNRIGWAPIPPWLTWHHNAGFDLRGINLRVIVPLFAFSFCEGKHFLDDDLHRRIISSNPTSDRMRTAKVFLDINEENSRIVNNLPVEGNIPRWTGHPITRYKIVDAESPLVTPPEKDRVLIFRPNLEITTRSQSPIHPRQDGQRTSPEQQLQVQQQGLPQEQQVEERWQEPRQRRVERWGIPQRQETSKQAQAEQQEVPGQQQLQKQTKVEKREKRQQNQQFSERREEKRNPQTNQKGWAKLEPYSRD